MSAINPSVSGVGSFLVQSLCFALTRERERERVTERVTERERESEREERGLLRFNCIPVVHRLLLLCGSSSRRRGLVCSV